MLLLLKRFWVFIIKDLRLPKVKTKISKEYCERRNENSLETFVFYLFVTLPTLQCKVYRVDVKLSMSRLVG